MTSFLSLFSSLGKLLAALTGVVLTVTLLSACGGADAPSTADGTAGNHGSSATSDAGDDGVSSEANDAHDKAGTADGNWDGQILTTGNFGTAVVRAQRQAGSYKLDMDQNIAGAISRTRAQGRLTGDRAEVHSVTEMGNHKLETIATGGFFYLKSSDLATEKPWLKLDPRAKSGMGRLVGQLGGGADAAAMVRAFASAVSVRTDGKVDELDGLDTQKYDVSVPSSLLADQMGMPQRVLSELPRNIGYLIWVDEDNLIRRMEMQLELVGMQIRTEMRFSDYGEDVTIETPPADQTTTREPAMPQLPGTAP